MMSDLAHLKDEQHSESDARSQCSQRSDLGYHSGGAFSDIGIGSQTTYASSHRSVGSIGSQGSGGAEDRGFCSHHQHHPHHHADGSGGLAGAAAHMMNGETHFPPSMYHDPVVDAPKSDTATVCSGSVLEDIDVESMISQEALGQREQSGGDSSSGGGGGKQQKGHRRTNSAGNRLVDFADRSQEQMSNLVIPQMQKGLPHEETTTIETTAALTATTNTTTELTTTAQSSSSDLRPTIRGASPKTNGMGPPLPRTLLLQASRAESVRSFESKADSDLVAHVDTDDCGGSLNESATDAQSVLSQEEADVSGALATAAALEHHRKSPALPLQHNGCAADSAIEEQPVKPHPFLLSDSDPQNGRTSPGGTIYRGRGVRRYQGRHMHLPFKRFIESGIQAHDQYPAYYGDHDNWEDRYNGEIWEHRYDQDTTSSHFGRKRSRSQSRSRSRSRSPAPAAPARRDDSKEPPSKRHEGPSNSNKKAQSNRRYHRDDDHANGSSHHIKNGRKTGFRDHDRDREHNYHDHSNTDSSSNNHKYDNRRDYHRRGDRSDQNYRQKRL